MDEHRRRRRLRRRFDLHKAMFILPNLFTVSSIFCGFYGAITAAGATEPTQLYKACIAILFAMVFDSVDGRVARLTRTQSAFGVQMDSLADVISFGAAPALVAWHWGLERFGTVGLLACFFYTACGAIRLARFNVMAAASAGPSHFFLGLPIPAAAGLLVATIIASLQAGQVLDGSEAWAPIAMVGLGLLMVSSIKFRTFKATRMTKRAFAVLMVLFGVIVFIGVQVRPSFAILTLMGSYLLLGLAEETARLVRRLGGARAAVVEEEDEDEDDGLEPLDELLDEDEELLD
ncbi:MAG: CDP-diacylglycerol--serine O-phosphatidyltransferase [Myxococcales bacterium]|nr:CDP-diacylglycerol--serine O-phosphatidyltransferase [Myxococcales bacterium]